MNNKKSANIYIIISIAMGYLMAFIFKDAFLNGTDTALMTNLLNIVNNLAVTAVPVAIYLVFNKRGFKNSFKKVPAKSWTGYALLAPVLWGASNYISIAVNNQLEKLGVTHLEQLPQSEEMSTVVTGVILACVLAPVFEELLYRGVVLSLLKGYGNGAAVAVSAVTFALAHGSITLFASTLVCGLVLGYVTVRSGSILPAMFIHFCCNLISCIIQYGGDNATVNIAITIFMLIVGAAASVWAFIKLSRRMDKFFLCLGQVWQYIKNPLWIPIVADFVFRNYLYHG